MKIGQKILGKKMFAALMKQTFYGQFVAGEVNTCDVQTCLGGNSNIRSLDISQMVFYYLLYLRS